MNEENKKIGMSTLNWVLSICGILILLVLIALPPVLRKFEEIDTAKKEEEDKRVVVVTCAKQLDNLREEYAIHKNKDDIQMLAYERLYNVTGPNDEQNLCLNNTMKFRDTQGLYYECFITETEITTNARITFSEFDIVSETPFDVNYRQGAQVLENDLKASGFSCSENG